ncbi:murein DD-endopeptidase MepM [[Haemophilus] ducreyi]|uniref:murein DD-endopeptidase MepM n=1 Tax=Haemophilus ducreyi TaxID=730 RepID=UPI000AFDA24B|nr:murein DD-endopeptidase MepM [[Haemophilus] ducreyi]
MRHVVLARERRRKKLRYKIMLFFIALLSILMSIFLVSKNDFLNKDSLSDVDHYLINQQGDLAEEVTEQADIHDPKNETNGQSYAVELGQAVDEQSQWSKAESDMIEDHNATSYDDELKDQDDEVEGLYGQIEKKDKVIEEVLSPEAEKIVDDIIEVADEALRIQDQFSYTVAQGDKLKDVLEQSGLGRVVAEAMIERFPELANLKGGQQFYWILDNHSELEYMNWLVSEKEELIYQRTEDGEWAFQKIKKKGEWRQDVVRGVIIGSFYASLKNVGLSDRQIKQLSVGLQSQIATNRLRKGDRFAILVRREYVDGKVTDVGNVEGILVVSNKKRHYAIQADNGRYYSNHGETLSRGFARIPLLYAARISSNYNPRRLHPITRRIRPHNGVDFSVPTGTPAIAPGDGVVEHIAYQAHGAGRYIKIRHGHITTVYMHLSKALVKVGQRVKKGERIALSGNTGGSTGPHLHYELHINGRPVNPMTVKLPGASSVMVNKERQAFLKRAKQVEAKLKL